MPNTIKPMIAPVLAMVGKPLAKSDDPATSCMILATGNVFNDLAAFFTSLPIGNSCT